MLQKWCVVKKKKVDETPPFLFWIMEKLTSPLIYILGFPIFHTFIVLKEKTKKKKSNQIS